MIGFPTFCAYPPAFQVLLGLEVIKENPKDIVTLASNLCFAGSLVSPVPAIQTTYKVIKYAKDCFCWYDLYRTIHNFRFQRLPHLAKYTCKSIIWLNSQNMISLQSPTIFKFKCLRFSSAITGGLVDLYQQTTFKTKLYYVGTIAGGTFQLLSLLGMLNPTFTLIVGSFFLVSAITSTSLKLRNKYQKKLLPYTSQAVKSS